MSTLLVVALLAVTAIVTGTRVDRLRSNTRYPWVFALGATAAGAALAWPLSAYLHWALSTGFWPVLGMIAAGLAVGYLWPEYALGVTVGFAVLDADASAALLWTAATVAAYIMLRVRWTESGRTWIADMQYRSALFDLDGQRPWYDLGRVFNAVWVLVAVAPVAVAVVFALRVDNVLTAMMLLVVGTLISTTLLVDVMDMRRLTREFRQFQQTVRLVRLAAIVLLAAGPAGIWVAHGVPGSFPWRAVVLVVAAYVLGLVMISIGRPSGRLTQTVRGRVVIAYGLTVGIFLDGGMFPFLAGGIFAARLWLLVVAAVVALVPLALRLLAGMSPMMSQNVAMLVSEWGTYEIAARVRESLRQGRRKPDLSLVALLVAQAIRVPHGTVPLSHELFGNARRRLRSDDSLQWLEMAESALDRIEPDIPAQHMSLLLTLRAGCAIARANLHGYLSQREEGAAAYRHAAELFERANMPDGAAFARTGLAMVLGVRLRQRAAAMAELSPLLDDESLSPMVRRRAYLIAMMVASAFDDDQEVVALREKRDRMVATKSDYLDLLAEISPLASRRALRSVSRATMRMYEEQELLFDMQSPTGTEHLPTPQGVFRVPERELLDAGKLLASQGKTRRAVTVLEEAAQLAELQGHANFVLMARQALADVHVKRGDRGAAWVNLAAAIDAHQRIRGLVLDQDARTEVGGLWPDLFDKGVAVLGAGPLNQPLAGWPAKPYATAFELGELARSRALLELLGSRLDPDPLSGVSAEDEQIRLAALMQARQKLDQAEPAERERALREVRDATAQLEWLYDSWASKGGQATEYVALRRGQPAPYEEIRKLLANG